MVNGQNLPSINQQRDIRPGEIIRSEKQVQRTIKAFQSFINPFELESSQPLTSLASGAAMPEDVCHDVLNALSRSKSQKENFIHDRLLSKNVPFFDAIRRNKFKTMSSITPSKRILKANKKEIQYEATSGLIFQVFLKSQRQERHVYICSIP